MPNSFYTSSGVPATRSPGASSPVRAQFAAIEAAFDKMPAVAALQLIRWNAAGTAFESVASASLGLLPLTGGTLSGALVGTTATFNGGVRANSTSGNIGISAGRVGNQYGVVGHNMNLVGDVTGEYRYIGSDTMSFWRFTGETAELLTAPAGAVGAVAALTTRAVFGAASTLTGVLSVNGGTSQPLEVRTANQTPWAIALRRDDLGTSSRVFYHMGGWYFEHTPSVNGSAIWHAGNDGAGSGLDADLLDGLSSTSGASANTVAVRDNNGDSAFRSVTLGHTLFVNSATEAMRVSHDSGFIGFYNTAGGTRTGYVQGVAGSRLELMAENGAVLVLGQSGAERARVDGSGMIVMSTTRSGIGIGADTLAVNGSIGCTSQLNGAPGAGVEFALVNRSANGGVGVYVGAGATRPLRLDSGAATDTLRIDAGSVMTYGGIEVGYRDIPRVTGGIERGKMYSAGAGFTVNTGPVAGSAYSVVNASAAPITITQGGGLTLYNAATAGTGNRTLAARGMATIWYDATNVAYISGSGLT